ncbi:MAG: ATP-grasp domain-containing protein [Candidatus Melainabacteria bacterium]|nr:ATP-grasp domain-containing protein [Candidatus Melainabacteria bacterium]
MLEAFIKLETELPSLSEQEIIVAGPEKSSAYNLCKELGKVNLRFEQVDINDSEALTDFLKQQDPLSIGFEIESVSTAGIKATGKENLCKVSTNILAMIQDKGLQKQWYAQERISTAPFRLYKDLDEVEAAISQGELNLPCVAKSRTDGYDGRGVKLIRNKEDLAELKFKTGILIEKLIDIDKELAVIVVRDSSGKLISYPPVEMDFDEHNQLQALVTPAIGVSAQVLTEVENTATEIAEKLEAEGILAIEFILSKSGKVYVNEMAPRTHNSGHHSIEAYNCSQFEQYMRVLLGLELQEIKAQAPAAAIYNIVGVTEFEGEAELDTSELDTDKAFTHWYRKSNRFNRKLGHLTLLGKDSKLSLTQAKELGTKIKIKPKSPVVS